MKYLSIIFILISSTLIISIYLLPRDAPEKNEEIALTVNGHNISNKTLTSKEITHGYHNNKSDLYESVITREILLQEAQRQKIDKEDSFRKSLKEFYENSLITILLERKNTELKVTVTEAEIDAYLGFSGKKVSFTRLDHIPKDQSKSLTASGVKNTALFDDLAEPLRLLLASLEPGGYGTRFDTGNEKYAVRLDAVQAVPTAEQIETDRTLVKEMLTEYKREQMLNQWLTDLKAKALIKIHN